MADSRGGINSYLPAKQKYELLIRMAMETPVCIAEGKLDLEQQYVLLEDNDATIKDKKRMADGLLRDRQIQPIAAGTGATG